MLERSSALRDVSAVPGVHWAQTPTAVEEDEEERDEACKARDERKLGRVPRGRPEDAELFAELLAFGPRRERLAFPSAAFVLDRVVRNHFRRADNWWMRGSKECCVRYRGCSSASDQSQPGEASREGGVEPDVPPVKTILGLKLCGTWTSHDDMDEISDLFQSESVGMSCPSLKIETG